MKDNVIDIKSKSFALKIISLYKFLTNQQKEFILSKQILRSGTSIGANVREGEKSQTDADFLYKMYIAYKETNETQYWLELLYESGFIDIDFFTSLNTDCTEILKILSSITKTQREKILSKKSLPTPNS